MSRRTTLEKTIADILAREDEIIAALAEGRGSEMFSQREIVSTIRLCLGFMSAVAHGSADDLRAVRRKIKTLRDRTLETDGLLAAHTHENPCVIGGIVSCETALFDILVDNPAAAIVLAGFGEQFRTGVESALLAGFTDIRRELEADEGKLVGHLARMRDSLADALVHPIRATVGAKICAVCKDVFAKYGTELRDEVVREIRKGGRELRKVYRQSADSVVTITGPRGAAKCGQVRQVAVCLATATRGIGIHEACERTFRPIPGGYKSAAALFNWCHRNESKLMNYVNELRLARS